MRIQRLRQGNFGDCKTIKGKGYLRELRIDYGPGFRVYFAKVEDKLLLLLGGGNKSTQSKDIEQARESLANYEEIE